MSVLVTLSPRAQRESLAANEDWFTRHNKEPRLFQQELLSAFSILSDFPESGKLSPSSRHPQRRIWLMTRTGYHVYYRYDAAKTEVLILCVWKSLRRQPKI